MKFFYAISSLLFIAGLAHGQIRIGGSDLLAPEFALALSEYAESREIEINVDFAGSYSGREDLESGAIDFAILAIPDGMEMPGEEFRVEQVGAKVPTVVVPAGNPLSEITLRQLAGIFGEAEASNITRWGEVGLSGEWSTRSIRVGMLSAADHTLTRDLFRYTVLQSRNLRRNIAEAEDVEAVRRRLRQDNNGISVLDRIPDDVSGMKILSIARSDTDMAHAPSAETVANSDYPLRLPLYLVFREDGAADYRDILRFIVSAEGAEAMEEIGLVPLPEINRQRLSFEFQGL